MKKAVVLLISVISLLVFGVQCTFLEKNFGKAAKEGDYILDLPGIETRGFIRAAVDNSSTGYYIYRGRRMGYEYELLRDLAKRLNVQLRLVLISDIGKAFDYLEEGKVDLIAINLEEIEERSERANFSIPLGKMSTVLVGSKSSGKVSSWEDISGDTVVVRQGSIYKSQL